MSNLTNKAITLVNVNTLEVISFNKLRAKAERWCTDDNDTSNEPDLLNEIFLRLTGESDFTDESFIELVEFIGDTEKEFFGWVNEAWLTKRLTTIRTV